MTSSRGSSQPRDQTHIYVSCIGRKILCHQCHLGSPIRHITTPITKSSQVNIYQCVVVGQLRSLSNFFPPMIVRMNSPCFFLQVVSISTLATLQGEAKSLNLISWFRKRSKQDQPCLFSSLFGGEGAHILLCSFMPSSVLLGHLCPVSSPYRTQQISLSRSGFSIRKPRSLQI